MIRRISDFLFAILMVAIPAAALAQTASAPGAHPSVSGPASEQGSTEIFAEADDPLLGIAPPLKGDPTLIGGIVHKIDRVRNRVMVKPFGSDKKVTINFDERTRIYRDDVETTMLGIRNGERIYVDTLLDGTRVFAKNIRVQTQPVEADTAGQLLGFNPALGVITMMPRFSSQPVRFRLSEQTAVKRGGTNVGFSDLTPGSLIEVKFVPESRRGVAREISIIAARGNEFIFAGPVSHMDLRYGLLAVVNQTDGKTYDIYFDPARLGYTPDFTVGSEVTVRATFTGGGYSAKTITLRSPAQ